MLETGIKCQMHLTSETLKSSSGLKTGPIKVDDNIETKNRVFWENSLSGRFFTRAQMHSNFQCPVFIQGALND